MAEDLDILFLSETWMRPCDVELASMVDDFVFGPIDNAKNRGFGGVAVVVSPLLEYEKVTKSATNTIQSITIRAKGVTVSGLYVSPKAQDEEERQALDRIRSLSRGAAVIIGDLNARHKTWDKKSNTRGRRLVKWVNTHRWNVKAPAGPTFTVRGIGASTPDIAITKGVTVQHVHAAPIGTYTGSDHQPIYLTIEKEDAQTKKVGKIPKSARNNAALLARAATKIKSSVQYIIGNVEECQSKEQLESCYDDICKLILAPWEPTRRLKPGRFRAGWSWRLDRKARLRRKFYRRAKTSNDTEAWTAYKRMDKEIREEVKNNKTRAEKVLIEQITRAKPEHTGHWVRKLMMITKGGISTNSTDKLVPHTFTGHMTTGSEEGVEIHQTKFTTDETFEGQIKMAIKRAPRMKATGADDMFTEVLNSAPDETARILNAIWRKCGELGVTMRQWDSAVLVPIYKKGQEDDPSSYRPIALLSHARKVIESAITKLISSEYRNNENQLGFQRITGTETAILRHLYLGQKLGYTAVLDLKSAYDTVPRDRLVNETQRVLKANTCSMVTAVLQPMQISTVNDVTDTTGWVTRGVPQGSPVSPCLFNLFMDSYAELLARETAQRGTSKTRWAVTMFADDVKINASDPAVLQQLLSISELWSRSNGMRWSTSKCLALTAADPNLGLTFQLSGDTIRTARYARYLGYDITNNAVTATGSVERLKKARNRLHLLKEANINAKTMNSLMLLNTCDSLVMSTATYGIHMTPNDAELNRLWLDLEKDIIIYALGTYHESRRERLRDIAWMHTLQETKGLKWETMEKQIRRRATSQGTNQMAKEDEKHLVAISGMLHPWKRCTLATVHKRRLRDNERRHRKLPKRSKRRELPSMLVRSPQIKRALFQWHCGTFPARLPEVKRRASTSELQALASMSELMIKPTWTKCESDRISKAVQTLKRATENLK